MNNLKKYSKPFMVAEKFVANSYCVVCENKYAESWTLSDYYEEYQKFVLDYNENGILDESDLQHTQTTDNNKPLPDPVTVTTEPRLCWPCDDNNPSWDQVHQDQPLWYTTNPGNNSGHVYGYKNLTINYNHS